MSATLARKIRRIGLERTTYRFSEEECLTYDENGATAITRIKIKIPERHRAELSLEELRSKREHIIKEWRARRKARKAGTK